jgi:hypothetical protein
MESGMQDINQARLMMKMAAMIEFAMQGKALTTKKKSVELERTSFAPCQLDESGFF